MSEKEEQFEVVYAEVTTYKLFRNTTVART
jgi:hypothetical protein